MDTKFGVYEKFIIAKDDEKELDKIYYMLTHGWFSDSQVGIVRGEAENDGVYIATADDGVDPETLAGDLEWTFHGGNGLREYFTQTDRYGYTVGRVYSDDDELPDVPLISLGICCCPEEAWWKAHKHDCSIQSNMVGNSPCDDE